MNKDGKSLRYTAITARILLGFVFFAGGISYFFMKEAPTDMMPTAAKDFFLALTATKYFFPLLKATETVAGFMLFFKRWVPLALIILAPILINILFYGIFLDPSSMGLVIVAILYLLEIFLAWYNWEKYAPLFRK